MRPDGGSATLDLFMGVRILPANHQNHRFLTPNDNGSDQAASPHFERRLNSAQSRKSDRDYLLEPRYRVLMSLHVGDSIGTWDERMARPACTSNRSCAARSEL